MNVSARFLRISLSITLPLVLVACGGGGGGGGTSASGYSGVGVAPAELVPTVGAYVPVVVVNGTTDMEISAANSEFPNSEFVWSAQTVRAKNFGVTYSGTINADGSISNYKLNDLLTVSDFSTGTVLMTPGGRPVYNTTASTSKLCRYTAMTGWLAFGLRPPLAYTQSHGPLLVSAGSDNTCDTADDVPDGFFAFYDPSNQQAATLFFSGNFFVINPGGTATYIGSSGLSGKTPRPAGDPFKPVLNAPTAALFEDANRLWLLRPTSGSGSAYWSGTSALSIATTTGWEPIGYDESALYVYRNSSQQIGSGDWQVLKVDISTGVGTLLDSGTGSVTPAMGLSQIWANVVSLTSGNGSVRVIYKNGAAPLLKSTYSLSNGVTLPMAAGGGRIIFYTVRTGFTGFEVYNESTTNLYKTIPNAYVSGIPLVGGLSINRSPAKGVVYVAQPAIPAAGAYAGGTLASYDPVTDQTVTYGVLASAPIGGYTSAVGVLFSTQTTFQSFVLQGTSGSSVFATGSKKYSFTLGQANSLRQLVNRVQLNQ